MSLFPFTTLFLFLKRVGGDERDRTDDPLLAKQVLSQLSYTPKYLLKWVTTDLVIDKPLSASFLSKRPKMLVNTSSIACAFMSFCLGNLSDNLFTTD